MLLLHAYYHLADSVFACLLLPICPTRMVAGSLFGLLLYLQDAEQDQAHKRPLISTEFV